LKFQFHHKGFPTRTVSPGLTLNLKSGDASNIKTTVEPRLNSPEKENVKKKRKIGM